MSEVASPLQLAASTPYNPYDFSHPVARSALFAGRQKQVDDIRYYLDEAKLAPRPFNLALLGPRASGKTSLLNLIGWEARSRNFCVARLDLNESDATSSLQFFWKLFDACFQAACETPIGMQDGADVYPFGGYDGQTFDSYLEMVSSYEVNCERRWRPFVTPVQYAKAMAAGRTNANISEAQFRRDMNLLATELGRPTVVLFDECNVLAHDRAILQQLRNVFMNLAGYMLVFSGTPDLFPVMNEVFSPIARDFKRIEVGPFDTTKEARECIEAPLKQAGVEQPELLFDPATHRSLVDPTGIAGGRPYELQLLGHFLFKRLQSGDARRMVLDVNVLDDVLREIGSGSANESRKWLSRAKSLTHEDLNGLDLLCRFSDQTTFDQIWFNNYVLGLVDREGMAGLQQALSRFVAEGLLTETDGLISFAGDEFERLYLKYYAQKRGVTLRIGSVSPRIDFIFAISRKVGAGPNISSILFDSSDPVSEATVPLANLVKALGRDEDYVFSLPDARSDYLRAIYEELVSASERKQSSIQLLTVHVIAPSFKLDLPFSLKQDGSISTETLRLELDGMSDRARELGGEVTYELVGTDVPPMQVMVRVVCELGTEPQQVELGEFHFSEALDHWYSEPESASVNMHREYALMLDPDPPPSQANDLGYLYLREGRYDVAQTLLMHAVNVSPRHATANSQPMLGLFNLGVAEFMSGQSEAALNHWRVCRQLAESAKSNKRKMGWLLVPIREQDGSIKLDERTSIDLLDCVVEALAFVEMQAD